MKTKICFKQTACDGTPQSIENFYPHKAMGDGLLGKCKACTRKDSSDRRKRLIATDDLWIELERVRQSIKERKRYRRIKDTPGYRQRMATARQKYALKYPERAKAVLIANNALRDGRIKRKHKCERCGVHSSKRRLEKHHADYTKPLEVEWLCTICHNTETFFKN